MRKTASDRNGELAACRQHRTIYCATMATNLDVDIRAIEALMQLGNFRSKREAVDAAVAEAIAYRKQLKALEFLGTIDFTAQLAANSSTDVD
jgi:Bacterial antitoxin of type II TA system, VapB